MINTIIFDLDGVICHTDSYHYLAWKALADKLGIYFDKDINNRLRGVSRMESLNIILGESGKCYTNEEKQALAKEKNDNYVELLSQITQNDVSPSVINTLVQLKANGIKLAIGSSSCNALLILNRLGITEYFDAIADGNQIIHSKPNPEVFLLAARLLNSKPEECLVVEDAQAGIMAAKAGGMLAAAIGDASQCNLADYCLSQFTDLIKIME